MASVCSESQAGSIRRRRGRWLRRLAVVGLLALVAGTALALAPAAGAAGSLHPVRASAPRALVSDGQRGPSGPTDLGSNVIVFTPAMSQASVQAELDTISTQQVPNHGPQRYAIFFEPGTYGSAADPLIFQIGFYTEVAGLGALPQDVVIDGEALVLNQCVAGVCDGTDNFWRSLSNLTIDVTTPPAGAPTPAGALSPPSGDPYGAACDTSGELYIQETADTWH